MKITPFPTVKKRGLINTNKRNTYKKNNPNRIGFKTNKPAGADKTN